MAGELALFQTQYRNIITSLTGGILSPELFSQKSADALLAAEALALSSLEHAGEQYPCITARLEAFRTFRLSLAPAKLFNEFCYRTGRGAYRNTFDRIRQNAWAETEVGQEYRILRDAIVLCASCKTDATAEVKKVRLFGGVKACPKCGHPDAIFAFRLKTTPIVLQVRASEPKEEGKFADVTVEKNAMTFRSDSPPRTIPLSQTALVNAEFFVNPGPLRQLRHGKIFFKLYDTNARELHSTVTRDKYLDANFYWILKTILKLAPHVQVFDTTWAKT